MPSRPLSRDSRPVFPSWACRVPDRDRCGGSRSAVLREAFVDRAYQRNGALAPRKWPGAVLHGEDEIAGRAVAMVTDGTVRALDGTVLTVAVDSLCVHGDTPDSVAVASAVRRRSLGRASR